MLDCVNQEVSQRGELEQLRVVDDFYEVIVGNVGFLRRGVKRNLLPFCDEFAELLLCKELGKLTLKSGGILRYEFKVSV